MRRKHLFLGRVIGICFLLGCFWINLAQACLIDRLHKVTLDRIISELDNSIRIELQRAFESDRDAYPLVLSFLELHGPEVTQIALEYENSIPKIFKKYKDIEVSMREVLADDLLRIERNLQLEAFDTFFSTLINTKKGDFESFVAAARGLSGHDRQQLLISDLFEQFPTKNLQFYANALSGLVDEKLKAWAALTVKELPRREKKLRGFLTRIAQVEKNSINAQTDDSGVVSVLWYPKYPDFNMLPSATHTKIIVDGQVYGTMGFYKKMKMATVHERNARIKLRNGFIQFDIKVSKSEMDQIKHIVESDDYSRTGFSGCVQGSCAVINRATSFRIPPPFNQFPSLMALYLGLARVVAPKRIASIKFYSKNKLLNFLSADLVFEGILVQWAGIGIYLGVEFVTDKILSEKD